MTQHTAEPDGKLDLTIVIGTHNRPEKLKRALASIPLDIVKKVIVVNDGPDEKIALWEWPEGLQYIQLPEHTGRPGFVRHIGISASQTEFVTFMDDDDFLQPGGMKQVQGYIERHPTANLIVTWSRDADKEHARPNSHRCGVGPAFMEQMVIMRRKLYDSVGGFSPDLPCSVNSHLYWRLCEKAPIHVVRAIVYVFDLTGPDRISFRMAGIQQRLYQRHIFGDLDAFQKMEIR